MIKLINFDETLEEFKEYKRLLDTFFKIVDCKVYITYNQNETFTVSFYTTTGSGLITDRICNFDAFKIHLKAIIRYYGLKYKLTH